MPPTLGTPASGGTSASGSTIVAVTTPPGAGGVAILRLSGPGAKAVLARVFRPGARGFTDFRPRYLHHGQVLAASGERLDTALAVYFPAPRSFTGEDVAELQIHGGPVLTSEVLAACLAAGAVAAEPGEFTKRAFLNGKLDLSQAEAVAEAVAAPSRAALSLAQTRLSGGLRGEIETLSRSLEELKAQLCLAVDFPEDEVDCLAPEELRERACRVLGAIETLLASHERTRPWREGARVVLTGRVNAGKSSLLNALSGKERAIVTDVPGTTRDYLETVLSLGGVPIFLTDTAGLRCDPFTAECTESEAPEIDLVEAVGIARSLELAGEADLVLLVLDGSLLAGADAPQELLRPELEFLAGLGTAPVLPLLNKADLIPDPAALANALAPFFAHAPLPVSAKAGTALSELTARAVRLLTQGDTPGRDEIAPNARQAAALDEARGELSELVRESEAGLPYDLLATRLDAAALALAGIIGRSTPDDVLNAIFSSFCIGK